MGKNKQKDKQKGPGKGKKESAVFKVAGVRKPKIKSVNTNLKKVRGGGGVLHIIERQKVEFDINSFRVKLYCLDCVHHKEKNSLLSCYLND